MQNNIHPLRGDIFFKDLSTHDRHLLCTSDGALGNNPRILWTTRGPAGFRTATPPLLAQPKPNQGKPDEALYFSQ